jgi:hypothetical protein
MKKYIPLIVSCLLCVSCITKNKETSNNDGVPYVIDVIKYVDNIRPVMLSEIGSSLEYIPLETSPDLMIGTLYGVAVYNDYLIVRDDKQVYLFDTDGNFIRKIGANGRGPAEYTTSRFYVDKFNDQICVHSSGKILCFDFDGTLVSTIELNIGAGNLVLLDKEKIMLFNLRAQMVPVDDNPVFFWSIIDHEGNEVASLGQTPIITSNPPIYTSMSALYMYGDFAHYMIPYSDSLFYLDGNDEKLYALFNFGKRKLNISEITMADVVQNGEFVDDRSLIWVATANEDKDFIYVKLGFGFQWRQPSIFDKKSQELTQIENDWFVNDIDGGVTFWPEYICDDNTLVEYEDAVTLVNHINEMEPFEKSGRYKGEGLQLEDLKGIIDENSNPVIILCKRD